MFRKQKCVHRQCPRINKKFRPKDQQLNLVEVLSMSGDPGVDFLPAEVDVSNHGTEAEEQAQIEKENTNAVCVVKGFLNQRMLSNAAKKNKLKAGRVVCVETQ